MDKKEITLETFIENHLKYYHKDIKIEFPNIEHETLNLLKHFCVKRNSSKNDWAWRLIIDQIPNELLTDDILDFLISNRIQIELLGHRNLSSKRLLQIYKIDSLCDEAIKTVGLRYLSDGCDTYEFENFINEHGDEVLYEFLLKQVIFLDEYSPKVIDKYRILLNNLQSNLSNDLTHNVENYLITLLSKEPKMLETAYRSGNYWQLLALSRNSNCTNAILISLLNVKNVKYGRQIRENARLLLEKRKAY